MSHTDSRKSAPSPHVQVSDRLWSAFVLLLPFAGASALVVFEAVELWNRPHMRFAWVASLVAVVLSAVRLHGVPTVRPFRRWAAIVMFGVSAVVFFAAVYWCSPSLGHLSAIGFFVAWAWGRFGGTHWAQAGAIGGLLLLTVPLPFGWDVDLTEWLRQFSVWATHRTFDSLSIPNIRYGDVIELRGLELNARELCGGFKSLYMYAAVAAVFLIVQRQSWVTAMKLLFCVPFGLVTLNFAKLLTIGLAFEYWQRDATNGWDFWLLDTVLAILFVSILWATAKAIGRLMEPVPMTDGEYALVFAGMNNLISWPQPDPLAAIPPEDEDDRKHWEKQREEEERKQQEFEPFVWQDVALSKWSVIAAGCLVLISGMLPAYILVRDGSLLTLRNQLASEQEVEQVQALEMSAPSQSASLLGVSTQVRRPSSDLGNVSVAWLFQAGRQELTSMVSFPFQGAHEAAKLRESLGWTIEESDEPIKDRVRYRYVRMQNELGGNSYLMFCSMDENGEIVPFQESSLSQGITILDLLSGERYRPRRRCFEVLVRYDASEDAESDLAIVAEGVFLHTVRQLREQLKKG